MTSASSLRRKPPLWSVLLLIPMMALLLSLGTWQIQRAQAKRALVDALSLPASATPIELSGDSPTPDRTAAPRGRARGTFDSDRLLLLDNQTHDRRPGYHVWSPLALDDGAWLIVNRGWIAQNPDRRQLPVIPAPGGAQTLAGYWRPLPKPGLDLQVNNCEDGSWPRVVQYPTVQDLRCLLGGEVANGVLLLESAQADGLMRDWHMPTALPPERHYAYAAQWYAFAATLLVLFVVLNLKRSTHDVVR